VRGRVLVHSPIPHCAGDHGQRWEYGRRMAKLGVSRELLARMLRSHGEDELAERVLSLSDDELARIGALGAYYAFSEDAMALGGSMGGARALSLAAIDVLEATGRDLRQSRSEWERERSSFDRFTEGDVVRDRELRRHAAEQQIPADESKRTLDTVDPPAWGPAPPDAAPVTKRCHELRAKPLIDFTVEELRFMIEQQVALDRLVPLALEGLQQGPSVEGDDYPGDLLGSVLRVDAAFWERFPDLDVWLRDLTTNLDERFKLEAGLRELIDTFTQDHWARRRALRNGLS
jgi:CDI immunity proteins